MSLAVAVQSASNVAPLFVGALSVTVQSEVATDEAGIGIALSLCFLAAALLSPPCTRFISRRGSESGMRLCAATSAGSLLGLAVLAHSWISFALPLMVAGWAIALAQPATDSWLHQRIAPGRLGYAYGLKQSLVGPGVVLVSGLTVPIVSNYVSWRIPFLGAGLIAVALALTIKIPQRKQPGEVRLWPAVNELRPATSRRLRTLIPLAVAAALGTATQNSVLAFSVATAVHRGLSEAEGGLVLALASVVAAAMRIGGGIFADRGADRSILLPIAALHGVAAGACLLVAVAERDVLFVAAIVVLGASVSGWQGLLYLAVTRSYPTAAADASGFISTAVLTGAVMGPFTFGVVTRSGYAAAWTTIALAAAAASIMTLAGRSYLRRPIPELFGARPAN